ncbi:DDE-type integrase/transposase/recombinase [Paenibacillus sp. YYML68]|uniref:DDE-type integrase/transposase/recombinase n=1 Tax=Paenibacillus sp. YYML68 TaxID=2909250 RepID=UPI00249062BE|nr:DDE-type integrase/transposase/recombinase [Paenibacillus sp. YYML68]
MSHQITKEQIALARYALIAPIVSRQTPLAPGELGAWLRETASRMYELPGSRRQQVSVRTLERYLEAYRKGGWEALMPRERATDGRTRLAPSLLQQAIELRRQRPARSVEQLIFLLEESGAAAPGQIAVSTLARHLRRAGVSRGQVIEASSAQTFRRFEAEDILELLQADFKHFVYLPDPKEPKKKRKTILLAILDDYSRYVVQAQIYWDEQLPRLEDSLKKAILRHGIPEMFYCDNGSAFSAHHLARICGRLGIELRHSRPYRPQGRGKVERLFQFVDSSFRPEVQALIDRGEVTTLEDVNQALRSWLDGYYHLRVHSSTKQTPHERFEASTKARKRRPLTELNEMFLWEEERTVDKTGCIQLSGNTYEVDSELARKRIALRYDPYDLTELQVWFEGKRYADAVPIDLKKRRKRKPDEVKPVEVETSAETLSFVELAEKKRQAQWEQDEVSYAQRQGGEVR